MRVRILQLLLLRPVESAFPVAPEVVGPLSTILMGIVILGEPFTAWAAAGSVLVIAGIFVFSRRRG